MDPRLSRAAPAALALTLAACGARSALVDGTTVSTEPDAGPPDAGPPDSGPTCAPDGAPCASDEACCSGACNGTACGAAMAACQPGAPAVVLATGPNSQNLGIAVDDTDVYWSGSDVGLVQKVSKMGGAPVTLAMPVGARGLALDDAFVYWASDAGIGRVPKAGGAPQMLGAATGYPWFIAVDDTTAYWTDHMGGHVMAAPKDGSVPPVAIVTGLQITFGLALSSDHVFFTDNAAEELLSVPKTGGQPTVMVAGTQAPWAIAVDATTAYWTEACGPDCGAVRSIPQNGGAPATVAEMLDSPGSVVVHGGSLYFADFGETGSGAILRVRKEGGAPVTLADGLYEPEMVAVDDSCVYWVDGHGTVSKIHK